MEEQKHLEGAGIEGAAERRKGRKGEREREREVWTKGSPSNRGERGNKGDKKE
jgi:hypothetical protein